uniref:Potassium channel domain-containing protein n=1 Tax=Lotharella globosa TaxID=91324 RepID=A0A7S3YWS4_9EUKA|eukprot:CAMPEP_0167820224 /NCGR_PEP_ID=MMETSP0112_2-20121227/5949_1 /TAXON_ID=91324 /ORGANISM="Lotharella globosa, Strain CCCM811" /LENGTH=332 /DNA_ID=CAMNT_0007720711 /DNA_START=109 /DNA_END=1107 /DNA_ORIENTATION=+
MSIEMQSVELGNPALDGKNGTQRTQSTVDKRGVLNKSNEGFAREVKPQAINTRTLAIAGLVVVTYFVIGIGAMSGLEGWSTLDSVYFAMATASTVGYGDRTPTSDGSKVFVAFYALVGVAFAASGLGVLFDSFMEAQERATIKALQSIRDNRGVNPYATLNGPALDASEGANEVQPNALYKTLSRGVCTSNWCIVALHVLIGMLVFQAIEKVRYVDAFYWAAITTLTVGYGDVTPKTEGGKAFAIFFMIASLLIVTRVVGKFMESYTTRREARRRKVLIRTLFRDAFERKGDPAGGAESKQAPTVDHAVKRAVSDDPYDTVVVGGAKIISEV